MLTSSTALLAFIAILITKKYTSKLQLRYTKLMDLINVIISVYEKTLKQPMIEKKIDQGGVKEIKKIYNQNLDKKL